MEKYVNILYRLARFLAGVPPELLGAMIIVVLAYPAALGAPAAYVVDVLGSEVAGFLLFCAWTWIIWPRLPFMVRGSMVRVRDYFDPARLLAQDDDPPENNAALEARVKELELRLADLENGPECHSSRASGKPSGKDGRGR